MDRSPKYQTERTRWFRERQLDEREEQTISHVETYGCSILAVAAEQASPGWSYTVGLHDTCGGGPELIAIGLKAKTAQYALNEAAARLRDGTDLLKGRHREMVGDVECEFRLVEREWIRQLMGWAVWYNGGDEFPVLQLV